MRPIVIVVVILWFCAHIVTAFPIDQLNVDNLTKKLEDGTSLLMGLSENQSERNQTIDGFDWIEGNNNITSDTFDLDGPSADMDVIDEKTSSSSIILNRTVQRTALVSSSTDHMRSIIFRQKFKPEARSFFGLIIIPCKCKK